VAKYQGYVALDLANVYDKADKGRVISTLAWGDTVEVLGASNGKLKVNLRVLHTGTAAAQLEDHIGYIKPPSKGSGLSLEDIVTKTSPDRGVLKIDFVDVQQGDAAVLESPNGQVVLIDGGDNQLFARYLAARYPDTTTKKPKQIACIVVTHGDADHFAGLTAIQRSETYTAPDPGEQARKRLFIRPERVYHNGFVKRPSSIAKPKQLGATTRSAGRTYATGLVEDPRKVPAAQRNKPFSDWAAALDAWQTRGKCVVQRLSKRIDGQKPGANPFGFLAKENIQVEVLGPLEHRIKGKPALRYLGKPEPKAARQPGQTQIKFHGLDPGHTINGHSIVLKIQYGHCRFLFTGDLNEESETFLTEEHQAGRIDLTAEVFKVPHHGSSDFSVPFIRAVSPAVSVISSGDESVPKEYIHPRATLVGALSKQGRPTLDEPLILVTELAAFFKMEGWVFNDPAKVARRQKSKRKGEFFAFSRKSFGIVKVRTNGDRMLVFTFSGKDDMKEAYAFKLQGDRVIPEPVRKC
jgi:beta-lactamase superfamily II metal-dependent hydrolase